MKETKEVEGMEQIAHVLEKLRSLIASMDNDIVRKYQDVFEAEENKFAIDSPLFLDNLIRLLEPTSLNDKVYSYIMQFYFSKHFELREASAEKRNLYFLLCAKLKQAKIKERNLIRIVTMVIAILLLWFPLVCEYGLVSQMGVHSIIEKGIYIILFIAVALTVFAYGRMMGYFYMTWDKDKFAKIIICVLIFCLGHGEIDILINRGELMWDLLKLMIFPAIALVKYIIQTILDKKKGNTSC